MQTIRDTAMRLAHGLARGLGAGRAVTVIPPYDSGGVGDQAMLDSTVGVVVRDHGQPATVRHITPVAERILLREACTYLDSAGAAARGRMASRLETVQEQAVVTLGADVIDGIYGHAVELQRLEWLDLKARQGKTVAVLGCSISASPHPAVMAKIAAMPFLRVYLRDEISLSRFEAAVGRPGTLVADTAFLLRPEITTAAGQGAANWIAAQRAAGRQVLAVNASGHTLEKMQGRGVDAHVAALRGWMGAGSDRAALFVPHDFRPAPTGDVEAVEAIAGALEEDFGAAAGGRLHVLRAPFNAWDLKALMGQVDALLTGRMHLSIAALGMGTPPLCVVYQGKYEGLMRHFGIDGLLMEPEEMLEAETVAARIGRLMDDAPGLRARIEDRLPAVTALSRRNFEWLSPRVGS